MSAAAAAATAAAGTPAAARTAGVAGPGAAAGRPLRRPAPLPGRRCLLLPALAAAAAAATPSVSATGDGDDDAVGGAAWSAVFDIPGPGFYTWSMERNESGVYPHPSLDLWLADKAPAAEAPPAAVHEKRSGAELQPIGAYRLLADDRTSLSYFLLNIPKEGELHVSANHDPQDFEQHVHYLQTSSGDRLQPKDHGHDHGHGHSHGGDDKSEKKNNKAAVNWSKALGILSIIASAVMGVGLRLHCPTLDSPVFFGYVNVLSGGMFISMAFFHILPETIAHMPGPIATLMTKEWSPLPVFLFSFLGFMLVLFFERVIFDAHGSAHAHHHEEQAIKDVLNVRRTFLTRNESMKQGSPTERASMRLRKSIAEAHADAGLPGGTRKSQGREVEMPGLQQHWSQQSGIGSFHRDGQEGAKHSQDHEEGHMGVELAPAHDHAPEEHGHGGGTSAILLMASLSVHSVFEGVVVGTADAASTVWLLVAIVVAHKWAAAFAIANQLTPQQRKSGTALILLSMFALASPIGAVIGWLIDNAASSTGADTPKVIETILNGLAVGTLLYIGLVEVVPEEFTGTRNAIKKFAVLFVAAGLVLFLTLLHMEFAHDHSHGGDGDGHGHGHGGDGGGHGHDHGHSHGGDSGGHSHDHSDSHTHTG